MAVLFPVSTLKGIETIGRSKKATYGQIYNTVAPSTNTALYYSGDSDGSMKLFPYLAILSMISGSSFITSVANTATVTLNVTAGVLTATAIGGGSVTTVSVVTANGFSGVVATPTTTPAITLSTTITATNIIYSDGIAIVGDANWVRTAFSIGLETSSHSNTFIGGVGSGVSGNNTMTGSNNLGIGYNTLISNTNGSNNIAVGGGALTANNGLGASNNIGVGYRSLFGNATGESNTAFGSFSLRTNITGSNLVGIGASTDVSIDGLGNSVALGASSIITLSNQIVFGKTSTPISNWQIAGVDYVVPTTGGTAGQFLQTNGATPQVLSWATASGGGGSVTTVSVVSANGFAGTVTTATTTPAITISTTITGIIKGNGTAIGAAVAGTDYQVPITLTTTGTSGAATFISNSLNIPQYQAAGTYVTSVTGTANRITSTGGATPQIDIAATYVGQTTLTTLGVIGTGTWQATKIDLLYGGTNADLSATGGTANYLKQSSVGAAITVGAIPASDIGSGQALTRVNDTNTTITLSANAPTALLAATSLTLGWTGTLAPVRGGTGQDFSSSSGMVEVNAGTFSITESFGGGALIDTQVASNSATIDFTNKLTSTYTTYVVILTNFVSSTNNNTVLYMRQGTGSTPTYQTTGYFNTRFITQWNSSGASNATAGSGATSSVGFPIPMIEGAAGTYNLINSTITIPNPSQSAVAHMYYCDTTSNFTTAGGVVTDNREISCARIAATTAVTSLRFLFDGASALIASGTAKLYGYK